jgi:hypothetical protein
MAENCVELLDPKNDYVFKRLFGEHPALVVSLINDLRPEEPAILAVEVLNPEISADELRGKYIILDLLARDETGHEYNIEMQVRRDGHWQEETTMAAIEHPPIREAMSQIRQLSADEHARRLAFVRERALHDEATLLKEARQEGLEQGLEQGLERGLEQGLEQGALAARRATALAMLRDGQLDEGAIARYSGLALDAVQRLRQETPQG